MNNKRRRRKTVLDLNTADGSNSDATSNKAKYQKTNGLFGNSLTHLLEQYNSDSDDDTSRIDKAGCLDEKVNDFFKEIQCIGSENEESHDKNNSRATKHDPTQSSLSQDIAPSSLWQECFDESTGYPYYWHTETNQVTWEIPTELNLARNNDRDTGIKSSNKDPPRSILPSRNPCQYSDDKLMSTIPEGMIPKNIVARNRFKQVGNDNYSITDKRKIVLDKRKKSETKEDDSDDGRIEMITSFGSDNTDSDHSDDEVASPSIQKNIPSKINYNYELNNSPANGNNCNNNDDENNNDDDNVDDNNDNGIDEIADNSNSNNKIQTKNNVDHENELAFSLVPGYADESDNEENLGTKKKIAEPLFPITAFENNQINERNFKIDSNIEESGSLETFHDSADPLSADDTKNTNKIDEAPKTNKFLENLGTSTKAFQRKKRIAFDVIMQNSNKKSGMDNSTRSQSETTKESTMALQITRGNDSRHGLGFSKVVYPDENERVSNSPEDTTSLHISTPTEGKKDGLQGKSIGFVKGETLVLTKNIEESNKCAMTEDTQTIVEKLKFLSEGSQAATAVQIMNIQIQTLLSAWESGDLKDRYFSNWLSGTNRELCRLEKAAAPPGWDCQWDRSHKRYYYRNEISGETRWSYPDIIGGAEEMELCTTPPPPDLEEKNIDGDLDEMLDKNLERNQQLNIPDEQYRPKPQQNPNTNGNHEKDDLQYIQERENSSNEKCQRDEIQVDKVVETRVSSPSPPPPPRISGDDLTRDRKKRRDIEYTHNSVKIGKNEEVKIDKVKEIKQTDDEEIKIVATTEVVPTNCEPIMVSSHHSHLLASNPTHAEPLPPGVDQPEMPYAIAAASIEPSVIFSTAAPQTNASIYAATMQDPTSISIIGHHHPALVQNQLVHYPAYHPHLQNQAIIAAANRLAGPDTVQFMLDYSRIYANTQVIAKPPVKTNKEPLGTALDSFYNDIASLESHPVIDESQHIKHGEAATSLPLKSQETPVPVILPPDPPQISNTMADSTLKDKKKKKVKIVASKKQKQVSSMVAKWKKAQNYEGIN
ncbi:hypothetical protein PV327_002394 [Microctonus hyperodae]|uniref:WW domain-containing protein n=1 Tax=Microctonus hyperodae TaxID=165561 RepID=A0AA39FFT7_MICHY|nr:hypothetical protein PV327_002394 [Microctonus hyperodae]